MQKDEYGDDILNVGELIEILKKFDKNKLVITQGCDCTGNAVNVEDEDNQYVIITRGN